MTNILFCNTTEPQCGVYQYGRSFGTALTKCKKFKVSYSEPSGLEGVKKAIEEIDAKAVIYNWQPNMGGWMEGTPFPELAGIKQILVYHDCERDDSKFDAVLFSNPAMKDHGNRYSIPRPLPQFTPSETHTAHYPPWIGLHGFYGASAIMALEYIERDFPKARVRMHMPFAHYGDGDGNRAKQMAAFCRLFTTNPDIQLEIDHDFWTMDRLLHWLSENDLNCYVRDTERTWLGVSSALDAALAVRKPIAINKCDGFRHLFNCQPSICVEDRNLRDILASGIEPLKPLYEANSTEALASRVETILEGLGL